METPASTVAAALNFAAVGVDQAMTLRAEEADHADRAGSAVNADLRGDHQWRERVGTGQVQAEFRAAVPAQRPEVAPAHQMQAERGHLVQQRPELAGLERGQVDRLVVAVAVTI